MGTMRVGVPSRRRGAGARGVIASPADIKLEAMENVDRRRAPALPYRIGHGFDLHRLEEGPYKLILGGLEIPHDRGCVAHSDGMHALHMCIAHSGYQELLAARLTLALVPSCMMRRAARS